MRGRREFLSSGMLVTGLFFLHLLAFITMPSLGIAGTDIYDRATVEFKNATLFKPAESSTNDLTFALAPLIIQEVKNPGLPSNDQFASIGVSNGAVRLGHGLPVVYSFFDSIQVNGRAHARFTFVWLYPGERRNKENRLSAQGVRLTLNTAGEPALWEALIDGSGKRLLFVSHKLEAAARAEFGPPLEGRKFAIERSRGEAPDAMVARVVEDGPMPMGPIVYLSAEAGNMATLICRCMPAQAKSLLATTTYQLHPLSTTEWLLIKAQLLPALRTAFWPGQDQTSVTIANSLRLPTSF